jgi:hypothetical protein
MAVPRQGLPVRLDRAPQRGAAFALTRASRRARMRSPSHARASSLIFDHSPGAAPPPSPGPARHLVARNHRLPASRHVHLLMNVLHSDVLVSARSLALKREQALLLGGCMRDIFCLIHHLSGPPRRRQSSARWDRVSRGHRSPACYSGPPRRLSRRKCRPARIGLYSRGEGIHPCLATFGKN